MATIRPRRNGTWEATIRRAKLLPKPVYLTFSSEEEANRVCARLEQMLDAGIVPPELLRGGGHDVDTLAQLIRAYIKAVPVTLEDEQLLAAILLADGAMSLTRLDYDWAETWVSSMKRGERPLAPSTIRKYVGALARCCDWGANKGVPGVLAHPLRRLPRGYSTYTREDERVLREAGRAPREDEERDRRLAPEEEARAVAIMRGAKPEGRERAFTLPDGEAQLDLFFIALDSCMRMREIFTLTEDQVDFRQVAVLLERTKNGDKRVVPMMTQRMEDVLRRRCAEAGRGGRLFPWWNGGLDKVYLSGVSSLLSQRFSSVFDAAGCSDFRFHDVRHEATSRLFQTTDLSDTEIARITGHRDPRSLRRYSHLRPSNIAARVRAMRG